MSEEIWEEMPKEKRSWNSKNEKIKKDDENNTQIQVTFVYIELNWNNGNNKSIRDEREKEREKWGRVGK